MKIDAETHRRLETELSNILRKKQQLEDEIRDRKSSIRQLEIKEIDIKKRLGGQSF